MRFSDFSEELVGLTYDSPSTLCSVTFTVPPSGAHARIDVNVSFHRSPSGPLAAGYFIVKDGIYPRDERRYRGIEVTGQHFPVTYVMHEDSLTPDATVTYSLVAGKIHDDSTPRRCVGLRANRYLGKQLLTPSARARLGSAPLRYLALSAL
jgi:hypothetical protein